MRTLLSALLALALTSGAVAEGATLHIACAANFRSTLAQLAEQYQAERGQRVLISSGSTGALYAQIVNGARFDLLLAADTWRPQRLAEQGLALESSLQTYAVGQLGLVSHSPLPASASAGTIRSLLGEDGARVALANPDTAPYGSAARQALQQLGLWTSSSGPAQSAADPHRTSAAPLAENIEPTDAAVARTVFASTIFANIIFANNVAQAFQFFSTGNTEFALVGSAQWRRWQQQYPDRVWLVPATFHAPLSHGAVIVNRGQAAGLARDFLDYLLSDGATAIIEAAGYQRPPGSRP